MIQLTFFVFLLGGSTDSVINTLSVFICPEWIFPIPTSVEPIIAQWFKHLKD